MRTAWLVVCLATAGCGSTVVLDGEGRGTAQQGLEGQTLVATMRNTEVVVADDLGELLVAWQRTTFFPPLQANIAPSSGEVGFSARADQYDPDYTPFAGVIGMPQVIPGATPTGDVIPLGGDAVAFIEQRDIRITSLSGKPLGGDAVAETQALRLVQGRDGKAVYATTGSFDGGVVQRVDIDSGEVTLLGTTEVDARFDVNSRGQIAAVSLRDVLVIDEEGETVLCSFEDRLPDNPQWSPDGEAIVVDAAEGGAGLDEREIFVCTADGLRQITNDSLRDRYPVFDASGDHVMWTRDGDLVIAAADGSETPEVLVEDGFLDSLDVAWLAN